MANKIAFLLLLICMQATMLYASESSKQIAQNGTLDLSQWDFEKEGLVDLVGNWHFYWLQLYTPQDFAENKPLKAVQSVPVPDLWNKRLDESVGLSTQGYATYRLKIKLPPNHPQLRLRVLPVLSAYNVWVNGQLVASNGTVGKDQRTEHPGVRTHLPLIPKLANHDNELEIVLHISNFSHRKGGFTTSMTLGSDAEMVDYTLKFSHLRIFALGGIVLMSLYHFGLFSLRREERSSLYFGLFATMVGTRTLITHDYLIQEYLDLPWEFLLKLEYLSFYLAAILCIKFFQCLYRDDFNLFIINLFTYTALGFCAVVLLFPAKVYSYSLIPFYAVLSIHVCYVLSKIKGMIARGASGIKVYLLGILVLILTVINDALYNEGIIPTTMLAPFGLLAFIFTQSYIVSARFAEAYVTSQKLTRKLKESNDIKSELLATISHELRTPMNGILGNLELIQSEKLSNKFTDNISHSANNMMTEIDQIIEFVELQAKKTSLQVTSFSLKDFLAELNSVYEVKCQEKGLAFKLQLEKEIPETITTDRRALYQILDNLLNNAVKFTQQGEIIFSLEAQKTNTPKNKNELFAFHFSVTDTGQGIAMSDRSKVFDSFRQADATYKREFGGLGLGLAITRGLSNLLNGSLTFVSSTEKSNSGTRFHFLINAPAGKISAQVSSPSHPTSDGSVAHSKDLKKLLIVEDNPTNQLVIKGLLKKMGYQFKTAENGLEAIEILSKEKFDLILMDCQMPIMDGFEATEKIRAADQPYHNIPIIAVTANTSSDDRERCYQVGMCDFLEKPVKREKLKVSIEAQLSS